MRGTRTARIWSRQGVDLTAAFPEIAEAAVRDIPPGCVLDGELVILDAARGRTDFARLGRRLGAGLRTVAAERRLHPASWVGFDLLAVAGIDVRPQPLRTRHRLLEELAADWAPPLQLCPSTTDHATAVEWMASWASVGVEGIVAKALAGPYVPGARDWVKVRHLSTAEIVIGAITGTRSRATSLVGGRYDSTGRLRIVARSTPLPAAVGTALAAALVPGGPAHPWPDTVSSHRFSGGRTELLRVDPVIVAEVAVDPACDRGVWRHPTRYQRLRPDLGVEHVPLVQRRSA